MRTALPFGIGVRVNDSPQVQHTCRLMTLLIPYAGLTISCLELPWKRLPGGSFRSVID